MWSDMIIWLALQVGWIFLTTPFSTSETIVIFFFLGDGQHRREHLYPCLSRWFIQLFSPIATSTLKLINCSSTLLFYYPKIRDSDLILFPSSHLYYTTIFLKVGTKVWDLTGNLLINSRMWALKSVSFQKCWCTAYQASYRTQSAHAFSSHPATWASLIS